MSTPPRKNDDPNAVFQVGASGQPQQQPYQPPQEYHESIVADVAGEVVDAVGSHFLGGCLLRPLIWLAMLPVRLLLKIIEAIFD